MKFGIGQPIWARHGKREIAATVIGLDNHTMRCVIACEFGEFVVAVELLRPREGDGDGDQVVSWDGCPWRPSGVAA